MAPPIGEEHTIAGAEAHICRRERLRFGIESRGDTVCLPVDEDGDVLLWEQPGTEDGKQQYDEDRRCMMPTSKTTGVVKEVGPGDVPWIGDRASAKTGRPNSLGQSHSSVLVCAGPLVCEPYAGIGKAVHLLSNGNPGLALCQPAQTRFSCGTRNVPLMAASFRT